MKVYMYVDLNLNTFKAEFTVFLILTVCKGNIYKSVYNMCKHA